MYTKQKKYLLNSPYKAPCLSLSKVPSITKVKRFPFIVVERRILTPPQKVKTKR
jgi:hypothetical protein